MKCLEKLDDNSFPSESVIAIIYLEAYVKLVQPYGNVQIVVFGTKKKLMQLKVGSSEAIT